MPLSLSRFPDHPSRSKLRGIHLKIKDIEVFEPPLNPAEIIPDFVPPQSFCYVRSHLFLNSPQEAHRGRPAPGGDKRRLVQGEVHPPWPPFDAAPVVVEKAAGGMSGDALRLDSR